MLILFGEKILIIEFELLPIYLISIEKKKTSELNFFLKISNKIIR